MASAQTRLLGLLAPAVRTVASLLDGEAQLARLELTLADAERTGNAALAGRLAVLRHQQQAVVLGARHRAQVDEGDEDPLAAGLATLRAKGLLP